MKVKIQQFVEDKLEHAEYAFDEGVKQWAGWIKGFPGVYSQGKSIEGVRRELAEMMEEYILTTLQKKKKIKGLNIKPILHYAKAN